MKNLNTIQKEILKKVTDYKKWNQLRKAFKKTNKEALTLNDVQKAFLKSVKDNEKRLLLKKEFKLNIQLS